MRNDRIGASAALNQRCALTPSVEQILAPRPASTLHNRLPILCKVLGSTLGQRLGRPRWVVGPASAHDRGAQYPEVRHLTGKAEAVDDIGLPVVAHAGTPI